MKFASTLLIIATIVIGSSLAQPTLLNKNFCKSKLVLLSKPCFPSLLTFSQLHFGTPCGNPPHLCTCGTNIQRPAKFHKQSKCSLCGGFDCGCDNNQSSMGSSCGPQQQYGMSSSCGPQQYGRSSSCGQQQHGMCSNCGPQLEEKDLNIKLRILVPKFCSIHPY